MNISMISVCNGIMSVQSYMLCLDLFVQNLICFIGKNKIKIS